MVTCFIDPCSGKMPSCTGGVCGIK
jgi:hypothetical protein